MTTKVRILPPGHTSQEENSLTYTLDNLNELSQLVISFAGTDDFARMLKLKFLMYIPYMIHWSPLQKSNLHLVKMVSAA